LFASFNGGSSEGGNQDAFDGSIQVERLILQNEQKAFS